MKFPRGAVFALAWFAVPGITTPDSWWPFCNQRIVSASERRYVVIKESGEGITYELCERAAGAAPITEVRGGLYGSPSNKVDRDAADRVLATGKVGQLPLSVLVPETLDGFLLFEKYYEVGYGQSVTYIDGTGAERLSLTLAQLFGEVPKEATRSTSSIWWDKGYWIDEVAQSIVVVAVGEAVREVAIADGKITTPDLARLLTWSARGTETARALALEVLSRRPRAEVEQAAPLATSILRDAKEAMPLRLRAAVVLCMAGTQVDADALFAEARGKDQPNAVRQYAVRHLPTLLGDQAIPILRDLMREPASPVWGTCQDAFSDLGERAVPTLIAMLGEQGETVDYRGGAAHALGKIKSPAALDALLEATATAEDYVANVACNAAIATGGDTLTEHLIAILSVLLCSRWFFSWSGEASLAALVERRRDD